MIPSTKTGAGAQLNPAVPWRHEEDELTATSGRHSDEERGAIHTTVIEEDTVALHAIGGPLVFLAPDGHLGEMGDWESTELACGRHLLTSDWRRPRGVPHLTDLGFDHTAIPSAPFTGDDVADNASNRSSPPCPAGGGRRECHPR